MTTNTYSSGFILPIDLEPVVRIGGATSARAVHARVVSDFTLGAFTRLAGQLLCSASHDLGVDVLDRPIGDVSCASCRRLLSRWSRPELHARFRGYALTADGTTQAVAAMSTSMASALLSVSVGVLSRRGVTRIDLSTTRNDDLDYIRIALFAQDYGSVIRLDVAKGAWLVVQGPEKAEQIMRQQVAAFAQRGAPRVDQAARQRNRTIRLNEEEATALRLLGGAAWLRQRINRAKRGGASPGLGLATVAVTIRTTDAQWERVRAFGGYNWLRSIIRREMERGER